MARHDAWHATDRLSSTSDGTDPLAAQEPGRTFPTARGALPMPGTADLPKPRTLGRVLGPGVVGAIVGNQVLGPGG